MDDDLQQLGYGIIVYDALYRWRCDTQDETHPWEPPRTPALQSPRADTMSSLPLHYIKTIETHTGSTQAMPDDRVLLALDDGRSYVIDAKRLARQPDGTYQVELIAADKPWPKRFEAPGGRDEPASQEGAQVPLHATE